MFLLHHAITHHARLAPDRVAFRSPKDELTYGDLDSISNQLAHCLIDRDVNPGDRVGILLPRCIDIPKAIYGILKAGAVIVPLDPTAPADRIAYMLEDCGIKAIVSSKRLVKKYSKRIANLFQDLFLILDQVIDSNEQIMTWSDMDEYPIHLPELRILAEDLAYIMYTSGTTGVPKGIMHSHYSGMSYAQLSSDLFDIQTEDILANHSALHFDISTMGYFTMPYAGATTLIIPDAYISFPASLAQLIEQHQVTIWYSVPLALSQMLTSGSLDDKDFSSIRWVLFGGEPFNPEHLRAIAARWPNAIFSNTYGPAEVNQCTYYHIPDPDQLSGDIPLGYVWSNTEAMIIDGHGNQIDQSNHIGELIIRSATRMKGYWKQEDLTRSKLHSVQDANGIAKSYYKTGDLASYDDEGLLHFHGRSDRQVKIRGYRVELEEVQANLLEHEQIEEAAVYAIKQGDIKSLAAIYIGEIADQKTLISHLRKRLPKYAIPEQIRAVSEIPRTSAGKIDYKKIIENHSHEG